MKQYRFVMAGYDELYLDWIECFLAHSIYETLLNKIFKRLPTDFSINSATSIMYNPVIIVELLNHETNNNL